MIKSIWTYVLLAALAGGAGWVYYVHQQTVVMVPAAAATSAEVVPPSNDADLNKKRQEGIGSIRSLKPVPLNSGSQPAPNK